MTKVITAKSIAKAAVAASLLALTGCTGAFTVYALSMGSSLALTVEPQGMFGFESCADEISIHDPAGETVWEHSIPSRPGEDCENIFPLNVDTQLEQGTRYSIDGDAPGVYYGGQFELAADGAITNYSGRNELVEVPSGVLQ